jgi:hypothetical protein
MLILKAVFVAVTAALASGSSTAGRRLGSPPNAEAGVDASGRSSDGDPGRELIIGHGFEGCIELRNGCAKSGARLILGNCRNHTNGFDSRELDSGWLQLYSRKDPTMCITASSPLKDGTFLRLRKCKEDRDKQCFAWGEQLQPMEWENQVVDTGNFCIGYDGSKADVGDFIKLKKCTKIRDGESWWGDEIVPDDDY